MQKWGELYVYCLMLYLYVYYKCSFPICIHSILSMYHELERMMLLRYTAYCYNETSNFLIKLEISADHKTWKQTCCSWWLRDRCQARYSVLCFVLRISETQNLSRNFLRLITVLTKAPHWTLPGVTWVKPHLTCSFIIYFNICLSFTPRSPKWPFHIVAYSLKARIVEPQRPAFTRQRSVNKNIGIVFSARSVPMLAHATMEYIIPSLSYNNTAIEEQCFLRGPCRDVISRTFSDESVSQWSWLVSELVT
jgi:hypothetical protein